MSIWGRRKVGKERVTSTLCVKLPGAEPSRTYRFRALRRFSSF